MEMGRLEEGFLAIAIASVADDNRFTEGIGILSVKFKFQF
jgi:hypothetical protein